MSRGPGPVSAEKRNAQPAITPIRRQLDDFLAAFVNPTIISAYRTKLHDLIDHYGRAQYNRGYLEGAKEARW
jgi:hypothetical protein